MGEVIVKSDRLIDRSSVSDISMIPTKLETFQRLLVSVRKTYLDFFMGENSSYPLPNLFDITLINVRIKKRNNGN